MPRRLSTRYINKKLHGFGKAVNVVSTGKWILLTVLVGVVAGIGSLIFAYMLEHLQHYCFVVLAGYNHPLPGGEGGGGPSAFSINQVLNVGHRWILLVMPVLGGLLSGVLVYYTTPPSDSQGIDSVIEAYHMNKGIIKPLVPVIKLIAAVLTIGTGGSAGREGPMGQFGAGFGSFLAQKLKLSENERKILLMAGMGAGIGSIFRAPLGGAIFSAEVLYRKDMESEGLMPSIISSIVAYSIYESFKGWQEIFTFQSIHFEKPIELPLYIILALITMVVGIAYVRIFVGFKSGFFEKVKIPKPLKPALGGLMVGMIAFFFPAVVGSSYGYLQQALYGNLTITFMLVLALLKIFATTFTLQSGGTGGDFAPSLVIGGLIGGAFGAFVFNYFPQIVSDPNGYVLVGMAAFFSAVGNVPIASTILITEMSGSYQLLVPLIFASAISYLGAQSWSIYVEQLESRVGSISHRGEFMHEVLESVRVRTAYRPVPKMPVVNVRTPIHDILDALTASEAMVLPIKDDNNKLVGLVSLYDVRSFLHDDSSPLIIAADIMSPLYVLHLNDTLERAFEYFIESGLPEIPVLANGSDNRAIGTLSERGFLMSYEKSVKASGATSHF